MDKVLNAEDLRNFISANVVNTLCSKVYITVGDQKIHFAVTGLSTDRRNLLLETSLDDYQLKKIFSEHDIGEDS